MVWTKFLYYSIVTKSIDCGYMPNVHVAINNEILGSSKFSNQSRN